MCERRHELRAQRVALCRIARADAQLDDRGGRLDPRQKAPEDLRVVEREARRVQRLATRGLEVGLAAPAVTAVETWPKLAAAV